MVCPDCGSSKTLNDAGEVFCKKCGLELGEYITNLKGRAKREVVEIQNLDIKINPKQELYALKLGLKNNKLHEDWEKKFGFKLSSGYLKPEFKEKVQIFIKRAFENNSQDLKNSKTRIKKNWDKINNKFFIEMENLLNLKWPTNSFECYLSFCTKYGFHNSSKNFIIIQHSLDTLSNYIIANELFHIIFRNYINRFFKEKFEDFDKQLSQIVVTFVLLTHEKIKTCFPLKFTFDKFSIKENRELAEKLWPLWQTKESFKEFMISSYKLMDVEKTWVSY